VSPVTAIALAVIGFAGGVGGTALGPGGVLPTIGLFALTDLGPRAVAGTAIVSNVATGLMATFAYHRSGQLRQPETRRVAVLLGVTAAAGAPIGVVINGHVSKHLFGVLLGACAAGAAILVWVRYLRRGESRHPSRAATVVIGLVVAVVSGTVGIGGPMLTVPILVALRMAVLDAVAASQVQAVVIAGIGTVGYAGAIDWPLVALVGVPQVAGAVVGWRVARALPTRTLTVLLVVALLALAPYLALR
jgi:uncharacterized protein